MRSIIQNSENSLGDHYFVELISSFKTYFVEFSKLLPPVIFRIKKQRFSFIE